MRNYTLLFSFLLLFVVSDLDAQRSRRSSGRIDKAELKQSDEKGSKELHKAYGFESREEMKDFLLDKDLKRKDRRIVEKYGKGKKLSKGQNRRLEELIEEHRGKRDSSETVTRSGRVSGDRALSSRSSSSSRAKSRGRSGRQEAHDDQGPPPFEEVDANGDGEISREEARAFFGDEPDFDAEYDNVDTDNNGSVDPQEYADADDGERDRDGDTHWADEAFQLQGSQSHYDRVMGVAEEDRENEYHMIMGELGMDNEGDGHDGPPPFEEVDANGDGSISREEARAFFGDEPDFDAEYDNVDTDNSGSVNMDEWEAADGGDRDDEHDWYCQICDMHFATGEEMDDHAAQMGHTNADFDCDPNHDYPQMDPGPDGGCANYADCNGNGAFDVGEPCYEGDGHDGPPPFEEVDTNGDGEISREEARAFFGDEPDFDAEYDNVDTDNSGSVDPAEFEAADDSDQNGGQ